MIRAAASHRMAWTAIATLLLALAGAAIPGRALSQAGTPAAIPPIAVPVPNFWDPRSRPERPRLPGQRVIRFLTDDDYPPLHFNGPDGVPTGFAVELARAACEVLDVVCTVQSRRFDTLLDALSEGRGDAVAAAVPINGDLRSRFSVTAPYHKTPARFLGRRDGEPPALTAAGLEGKRIAVLGGTAHEAFLAAYFPGATLEPRMSFAALTAAVRSGEADLAFADGLALSLWLAGPDTQNCCRFVGGPYLDPRFFGEGVGFVLRPEDDALRRSLDYALHVLAERGIYAQLYLRFFPVSFY